jgi:hypothetical protein
MCYLIILGLLFRCEVLNQLPSISRYNAVEAFPYKFKVSVSKREPTLSYLNAKICTSMYFFINTKIESQSIQFYYLDV